ncbi:MAG TPA: response regulator [Blastocatellia bacterium]|nr:response regulator [Blastocatellia bacterium]
MARILIAEDFPDVRNILGLLLTSSGHEIIEASDGREAVEKAVSDQPDLILMDMSMPVLSGWDATKKLKANPKTSHIPVIALTAHALKGDKERAWQAGCDGFITKPIDNELLEHTIEQILSPEQNSEEQTGMAPEQIAVQETPRRSTDKLLNIHNQHILIIDADHDTADYISGELRSRGYRTSVAEQREQALSLMETDPVDLVICEIEVPDTTGYEITEQIKENSQIQFTPIILVTEGEIDWERALKAGADDFLAKPINPSKLLVRVRSLVRLKQAVASESGRANELASVLSQMMTGLIIADAEGVVTVVNGRGLEILGIPLDEVIGIQIDEMIGKLDLRDEGCDEFSPDEFPLNRALKQNEVLAKQLNCVRRRDGAELVLSFNAAPIYNEHGQKIGAVSLFDDITEAVDNLKQVDSQKRELESNSGQFRQLDQVKSRFIATLAHEVRTPLTAITALIELLDRTGERFSAEGRDVIRRLQSNVNYMNIMIQDLLDYSRIVAGKEVVRPAPFSPQELIAQVRDSFTEIARQRGIDLKAEIHAGLPEEVFSDKTKCRQVINNLVCNAIKYTAHGEVVIQASPVERECMWSVEVKDTGTGIPPDEIQSIFDEFHQGADRAESRMGRAGLGLPINKRLVELLGGRIEVESKVGEGTRFTVIWPTSVLSPE